MRWTAAAVSSCVLVACCAASAAAGTRHATRLPGGEPSNVRPAQVGDWTGDGTGILGGPGGHPNRAGSQRQRFGNIHWTHWDHRVARGRAVVYVDDCTPTCAGGDWHASNRTRVRSWRPRQGRFTRLRFAYDAGAGRRQYTYRLAGQSPYRYWIYDPR